MATVCVLATVDTHGRPQARTLVLRDLDDRLALFMNATSPKFQQLSNAPASVCIWLPSVQVQYRAHTDLAPIATEIIKASWHLRPRMPKVLDWFYTHRQPQSTAVPERAHLKDALDAFPLPEPLGAPDTARGFYLDIHDIERLDLNQPDGLHDRMRWVREGSNWKVSTLLP